MQSFKDYLIEAKTLPAAMPLTVMTANEIQSRLGKGKFNAMLKHKWFTPLSSYEKAYKYGVTQANFQEVEVYPYFSEVHRTPEGKIRPDTMYRFQFGLNGTVMNVHKFHRKPDDNNWYHLKSWKETE